MSLLLSFPERIVLPLLRAILCSCTVRPSTCFPLPLPVLVPLTPACTLPLPPSPAPTHATHPRMPPTPFLAPHCNAAAGTFTVTAKQSTPSTPGQNVKQPVLIPLAVGLLGPDGKSSP